MSKIVILNGPPRCGKDTAANAVQHYFGEDTCLHVKLSEPLKYIAQNILHNPPDKLEEFKNKELSPDNISYRDAQIGTFLSLAKVFGEDWLGRWFLKHIDSYNQDNFIFSDGGRIEDIKPFLKVIPPRDLLIIQIMREDCSFIGDIRTYITAYNVKTIPIVNKDLQTFVTEIVNIVGNFIGEND